jgi:OHCU decarboxylase
MVALRPFGNEAALLRAADAAWNGLGPEDWLEAFRAHPRIGEQRSEAPRTERERGWSEGEQAGAGAADDGVRAELAEGNRVYEARFGHIFIVCASGMTGEEMLATLRARLENPPDVELRVAAEEQRKITRLRLQKLLEEDRG